MDARPAAQSPEDSAGLVSRLFFCWMWPLIRCGHRKPLQQSDLYPLCASEEAHVKGDAFELAFAAVTAADASSPNALSSRVSPTLRALVPVLGKEYFLAALWQFVRLASTIAQVFGVRALVERVARGNSTDNSTWVFFLVAVGMFLAAQAMSISDHAFLHKVIRGGLGAQGALSSAIYRKALRLSMSGFKSTTEGQMGNLLLSDTDRVYEFCTLFHQTWFAVLEMAVLLALLTIGLGRAALLCLPVLLSILPLQIAFSIFLARARKRVLQEADPRVQLMGEVLTGIKTLKLNAWESHFYNIVANVRRREVRHLRSGALYKACSVSLFLIATVFFSLVSFIGYTLLLGGTLTPSITFSSLVLIDYLGFVFELLPSSLLAVAQVPISLQRLDWFFKLEELPSASTCYYRAGNQVIRSTYNGKTHLAPSCSADALPTVIAESTELNDSLRALIVKANFGSYSLEGQKVKSWSSSFTDQVPSLSSTEDVSDTGNENNCLIRTQLSSTLESEEQRPIRRDDLALQNINFQVDNGDLVSVVGEVGSGKTSLLLALLGEIPLVSGTSRIHGSIAYCAQEPWILNGTFRENVTLFRGDSQSLEQPFYDQVIEACCLGPDLLMLPAGDLTEIGDRGVNLSGGQKARLALARAIYSDADLYLLDDPLSAVDASVAKQLKDRVLGRRGILAKKARVIVTHQLQILPASDRIYVMSGGCSVASGTFSELVDRGVNFSGISADEEDRTSEPSLGVTGSDDTSGCDEKNSPHKENVDEAYMYKYDNRSLHRQQGDDTKEPIISPEERTCNGPTARHVDSAEQYTSGLLTVNEDRRVGRVTWQVYTRYVRAAGGFMAILAVALSYAVSQGARHVGDWWLAQWSTDEWGRVRNDLTEGNRFYALIYLSLAAAIGSLTMLRAILFVIASHTASRRLHNQLLDRVLHATPTFFERNPLGRILNRFSRDLDHMDHQLPIVIEDFLSAATRVLGTLVMISWILPWFLIASVPLGASFLALQHWYVRSSRELRRLDSVSKSPICAQFSETLMGLTTVRAFEAQKKFTSAFEHRINNNHRANHLFYNAGRWIGVRLDLLAACIIFGTSVIAIAISGKLDPGLAGIALSQSVPMTGLIQWAVRRKAECENLFTSVERVTAMASEAPLEAPPIIPSNRPDPSWPSSGVVEFDKVVLRYRPELEPALRCLSFKTRPCERIGVCGRTGAGKTSIVVALFRMVELSEGQIRIDGVDVSKIGLQDLRSRLAIVPQDPVLFKGTIRSNIDPLNLYSDATIWDALARVQMHRKVLAEGETDREGEQGTGAGQGLDMAVSGRGTEFSCGERQLLSLAQAIVGKARVLVLDEATSSVDRNTDRLIQQAVREHLRDCTVISIAHRLDTIVDSDRILVLEEGQVVEFDTPAALLDRGGFFTRLIDGTGPVESADLRRKIRHGAAS